MHAALYLRVSTRADKRDDDAARQRKRQDVENQRRQLRQFCETQGWQIVAEYMDEESGAKSDRAGFQRMWHDAAQRRFDVLLFWALGPSDTPVQSRQRRGNELGPVAHRRNEHERANRATWPFRKLWRSSTPRRRRRGAGLRRRYGEDDDSTRAGNRFRAPSYGAMICSRISTCLICSKDASILPFGKSNLPKSPDV